MKSEKEKDVAIYQKLIADQNRFGAIFGAFLGSLVIVILILLDYFAGRVPIIAFLSHGFFVGFFARFYGNPFERKYQLISAAIAAATYLPVCFLKFSNPITLMLILPIAIIAAFTTKRKLTDKEKKALFMIEVRGSEMKQ